MKKLLFTSLLLSGIFLSTITIAECRQGYTYAMGIRLIDNAGETGADFVDERFTYVETEFIENGIRYWGEACLNSGAKSDILIDWGLQSNNLESEVYDIHGRDTSQETSIKRYDATGDSISTSIGISWRW